MKGACEFSESSVTFLVHVIDKVGIHLYPNKVQAVLEIKTPTNVAELHRYLGMVTYLSKFTSNFSHKIKSLRDLLSIKNEWTWDISQ